MNPSKSPAPIREQARERLGLTPRPVAFRDARSTRPEPINDPRITASQPLNDPVLEIMRPRPSDRPAPANMGTSPSFAAASATAPIPRPASSASSAGSAMSGAWMMFLDALPGMFSPMTFFFHQRVVLWQAVVYATVPLVMAASFYLTVPGQISAYPLSTLTGWAYLACLFVASQIVFCLFLGLCRGLHNAYRAFAATARSRSRR